MRQVRAGSKRGFDENQNGHAKMPKFDSEVFLFHYKLIHHRFATYVQFKGSSDPSHFIFEINIGKSRIRHTTTLKGTILSGF